MTPMIIVSVIVVAALIWTLGGWLVVRNIEKPAYTLVEKREGYEIRDYAPYMVAEVEVTGSRQQGLNAGFRMLADYIFGNNTAKTGIAMTAPVSESASAPIAMTAPVMEQGSNDGKRKVTFSMPSKYTMDSIPKPNNPLVTLREIPAQRVAVKVFGWYAGDSHIQSMESALLSALKKDGFVTTQLPSYAGYNPPFSAPWMRRNEVMVVIEK
ncbi:MAG: heme-binding protein [bacterium]